MAGVFLGRIQIIFFRAQDFHCGIFSRDKQHMLSVLGIILNFI